MRRKDREITDPAKIRAIISACSCCRLGFADGESVYMAIMYQNTGKEEWEFSEEMFDAVCTFKLEVSEMSCKEHS